MAKFLTRLTRELLVSRTGTVRDGIGYTHSISIMCVKYSHKGKIDNKF